MKHDEGKISNVEKKERIKNKSTVQIHFNINLVMFNYVLTINLRTFNFVFINFL